MLSFPTFFIGNPSLDFGDGYPPTTAGMTKRGGGGKQAKTKLHFG